MKSYVAHVKQKNDDEWELPHSLDDHLRCVKKLAAEYAVDIGTDWAALAGI